MAATRLYAVVRGSIYCAVCAILWRQEFAFVWDGVSVNAAPKKIKQLAKTVKQLPVATDSLCPQRSVLLAARIRSTDQPEAGWVAVSVNRAELPGLGPDDKHVVGGA